MYKVTGRLVIRDSSVDCTVPDEIVAKGITEVELYVLQKAIENGAVDLYDMEVIDKSQEEAKEKLAIEAHKALVAKMKDIEKPVFPEWFPKSCQWNRKIYGGDAKTSGYRIYLVYRGQSSKKRDLTDHERADLERYLEEYREFDAKRRKVYREILAKYGIDFGDSK